MKKFLQSLLVFGLSLAAYTSQAQLNYSPNGATISAGTYTNLTQQDGQAITISNLDDDVSSSLPIGFTFNFNGASFTDFILSTNGFIKLGTSNPSSPALFFSNVQSYTNFPLASQNPADSNLIFAFGFDLEPSVATAPEFRYVTTGNPGSRVLTIQWKGMSDKIPTAPANLQKQYTSLEFQLKLYEGSNRIQVVMGNFLPGNGIPAFRAATLGLKGTGFMSTDVVYFSKASADDWATAIPTRVLPVGLPFNFRNNINPIPGQTYNFDPQLNDDLAHLGFVNTPNSVCGSNNSLTLRVRVKNNGSSPASNFSVSYQRIGGPPVTEVVNGTLAPNTDTVYAFTTPFAVATLGDTIRSWTSLTNDANSLNDSAGFRIFVVNPISSFPYTQDFTNPIGWTVSQLDTGIAPGNSIGGWGLSSGTMSNPTFTPSGSYAFFNSFNLRAGLRSRLSYSCGFNLSNIPNPRIAFNMTRDGGYAGQNNQAYSPDRVVVMVSTNNGLTFTAVDSVVRPDSTLGATTAVSWLNYTIDLSSVANQPNVLIALDAISEYGTNIALDSVVVFNGLPANLDTLSAFNLLVPTSGTAINLPGNPINYNIVWNRSVRSGAGPTVTYEWLVTLANGSFSSPLATIPANVNGTDSVLTLSSTSIDNLLATNGILSGQTANLKWTIRATSGSKTRLANTDFLINITRPTVVDTLRAFSLVSPSNNSTVNVPLSGPGNLDIIWRRSATVSGNPVTYEWLVDAPGGNFSQPLVTLSSNNSGADTVLSLSFSQLNALLNANGVLPGQTYSAIWTVRATSGNLIRLANTAFTVNILRISDTLSAFTLIGPLNNTNLVVSGNPSQTITISWRRSRIASGIPINYSWLLESPNGNFAFPITTILSNGGGSDTTLTLTFGQIATLLSSNNVPPGTQFPAKWSVRAAAGSETRLATTPFNITLSWNFLTSTTSLELDSRIVLFPNPAKPGESKLFINFDEFKDLQIQVTDLQGRVLNTSREFGIKQGEVMLPTTGLSAGMYLVVVQNGNDRIVRKLQLH